MRKGLLIIFLFAAAISRAQLSDPLQELKTFIKNQPPKIQPDSSLYLDVFNKNGLHYLQALYKGFLQEKRLLAADTASYYEAMAQAVSFIGDNASVLAFEQKAYDKPTDSAKITTDKLSDAAKSVYYMDAKQFILSKAKKARVVMINEPHDKPQARAFTASLLEEMYQQGFHYLAMEMLDNYSKNPIVKINAFTGYYVNEPVAAELVRKALEIGYTLVPYEDTVQGHTVNQREYAQAQNIYNFLSKKDTAAKILVHAGYGHIKEGATGERIPMAAYFKIISKIDPLTIDQTEMIENSTDQFGSLLYQSWIKKAPVTNSVVAMKDNKAVDPYDLNLYDIHVIHPPTKYTNGRPNWMMMNGWKKETPVAVAYRSAFLVQAYYEKE
ncbi:MAG: hypothetical protein JWQ30_539, partial [Sediminibacterium sp.]|nr:hypothetical protein [Sediminibacterium sp.]